MAPAVANNNWASVLALSTEASSTKVHRPLCAFPDRKYALTVPKNAKRRTIGPTTLTDYGEPVVYNIVNKWLAKPIRTTLRAKLMRRGRTVCPGTAIRPSSQPGRSTLKPQKLNEPRPPFPSVITS
jgi:hypothetical protein